MERARALFAQGVACVEEHETACAERAFREALGLRDAPAVRYNLASALFDLGRYPESARLTASVLADEAAPEAVRSSAQMLQQQLEAQGGTLAITLEGDVERVDVRVDGDPIPEAQRRAVIVAPGSRVVTAVRDGEELARREVEVQAAQSAQVTLTIAPPPEDVAARAPVEPIPAEAPPIYEDWRFWAITGAAVVVIAAIAIVTAVVVASPSVEGPIEGNYDPAILRWE